MQVVETHPSNLHKEGQGMCFFTGEKMGWIEFFKRFTQKLQTHIFFTSQIAIKKKGKKVIPKT
jgi:hypothetical protein